MINPEAPNTNNLILTILDQARWCPSPDNIQPWRFKIIDDKSFEIHCKDASDWMVYDITGHVTWLTLGFLFETLNISASECGYTLHYQKAESPASHTTIFNVQLNNNNTTKNMLFAAIKTRSVQRKFMGSKKLTTEEKEALKACIPEHFSLHIYEKLSERFNIGKLLYGNSTTRYMMKEGYDVHSKVIDWEKGNEQFSTTKIPPKSLGVDPITTALTKWALAKWSRFHIVEKYLAGTVWAKLLMDFCTSIRCSGHFLLTSNKTPETIEEFIESGQVAMRLWLTCEQLELGFQPEYTPIMFAEMVRNNIPFSKDSRTMKNALTMDDKFKALIGEENVTNSAYFARFGRSKPATARSIRKPLTDLLID